MTDQTITTKLIKSEISAHAMASTYIGTAFLSSSGLCMSNISRLEGEQISGVSSKSIQSSDQIKPSNPYKPKKDPAPIVRGGGQRVRKNLIRNRCHAFASLKRSRQFLAFYTITFPSGLTDQDCFSCLNIWLTRIRKWKIKFPYLWVAERQKNGTIHYHLLTNAFLPIRVVNGFMAVAIRSAIKKGNYPSMNFNSAIYNGVDVSRVASPERCTRYITKYITKSMHEQIKQKWHCSRVFSRLSVSLTIHPADAHHIISVLANYQLKDDQSIIAVSNDHFLYIALMHGPPNAYSNLIYSGNNQKFEQWKKD